MSLLEELVPFADAHQVDDCKSAHIAGLRKLANNDPKLHEELEAAIARCKPGQVPALKTIRRKPERIRGRERIEIARVYMYEDGEMNIGVPPASPELFDGVATAVAQLFGGERAGAQ